MDWLHRRAVAGWHIHRCSLRCVRLTNLRQSLRGVWTMRNRVTRDDGGPLTTPSSGEGVYNFRGEKAREGVRSQKPGADSDEGGH